MAQIHINTIADLCVQHGIERAIISPGSRNAALTIAFNRHPEIQCYSISDERSAAFIALGMAQATGKTVAMICTSGSAALNYAPAVAEAFFQHIPLLVLTADRPPEWIDQWDGQTIRQQNIYGRHVKENYQLPVIGNHKNEAWQAYRMVNEACIQAQLGVKGPVHINIPFREPFYPEAAANWEIDQESKVIKTMTAKLQLSSNDQEQIVSSFDTFEKVAILLGQDFYEASFLEELEQLSTQLNIPIFADVISNGHALSNAISLTDAACMRITAENKQVFRPDLIISFGKSIISKNLKLFLRNNKVTQWHISSAKTTIADPFQAIEKNINVDPTDFLSSLHDSPAKEQHFLYEWTLLQSTVARLGKQYLQGRIEWNEFSALQQVIEQIPEHANIHLANSLSVRYVNFIGLQKPHQVWCNRGTSGIDGSNSTTMGHAIANADESHYLITGDVAFFYDRNAFWHKYDYPNLKVILINNHGGSIFRMIKGPKEQAELEEFFETKQSLNASLLCQEFAVDYFIAKSKVDLTAAITSWLRSSKAALLEIQSESKINQEIFESFKIHIQN
jgi:2-succinyl-5-enolpyruvyl-6-hydroxy-3-cyclohexene-1-carboxylate synthase